MRLRDNRINVSFSGEDKARILKVAEVNQRSAAFVIRDLVKKHLPEMEKA